MTDRLLPRDEWERLAGTDLAAVLAHLPPSASVIVVEDDAGAIVGCWAAFPVMHAEGVWVAPEYRKRTSVQRRLWRRMVGLIRDCGRGSFVTAAMAPEIHALLAKRAVKLPQEYAVCLP